MTTPGATCRPENGLPTISTLSGIRLFASVSVTNSIRRATSTRFLKAVQRELQVAQVRLQVLQYASIYEAILHHLLFDVLKAEPQVQQMLSFQSLKKYSVPPAMRETLAGLVHDGHRIVPAYYSESQVSPSKVRFDDKARCVCDLGLIDGAMRNDLISIYEARNAIHLHAELRKGISWELELSRTAYRRHKPLREQIVRGLRRFSR